MSVRPGNMITLANSDVVGVMTANPGNCSDNNPFIGSLRWHELALVIAVVDVKMQHPERARQEALILAGQRLGWIVANTLWIEDEENDDEHA